jgi:biopolymer transport protein ExbD
MGMSGGGGTRKLNSNINVTPFVDVMLVLLIIFMVVTPMLQKGVDVRLPVAEYPTDHPDNESVVTLAVKRDRTLYIDQIPVPSAELLASIREKFDTRAEKILLLKADEAVDYGRVMEVMEIAREGGVEEIGLITELRRGAGGGN